VKSLAGRRVALVVFIEDLGESTPRAVVLQRLALVIVKTVAVAVGNSGLNRGDICPNRI
jgi:hypothetical protein